MVDGDDPLPTRLTLGEADVDLVERVVRRAGDAVASLTSLEAGILAQLGRARGAPMAREALLASVWGASAAVRTRAVENTVSRLRRKIEADPSEPRWLVSVAGGYALATAPPAPTPRGDDRAPFVGRVGALEAVARALGRPDDAWRGPPVSVVGPPGIGVSRLVARAAAGWRDLGGEVIAYRWRVGDADPVAALARSLGVCADRAEAALEGRAGALVVVDLDDVDPDAGRDADTAAAAGWVAALARDRGARVLVGAHAWPSSERTVALGPLSPVEGAALVAHHRADAVTHAVAERVSVATGGSPLAIGLVAAWLPECAVQPDVSTVARALEAAWARLEPAEQRLVGVAAALDGAVRASDLVAGAGHDLRLAARLVQLGWLRRDEARLVMPSSIRAHLARIGAIPADAAGRHARWLLGWAPDAARATRRAWDPSRIERVRGSSAQLRQALAELDRVEAAAIAEALLLTHPDDGSVADDVLARLTPPPVAPDPRTSLAVGVAARAVGATTLAVDVLRAARDALTAAEAPELAGAVLAALGEALADAARGEAADPGDASTMLRAAHGLFDGAGAAASAGAARLALAELHLDRGAVSDAEGEAHAALAALAEHGSPAILARAHGVVARVHHRLGAADAADGHFARADALAERPVDRARLALARAEASLDRGDVARASAGAAEALAVYGALADPDGCARASLLLAAVALDGGRFDAARDRAQADTTDAYARDRRWIAGLALACLGQLDDAVRALDDAASRRGPAPALLALDGALARGLAGDRAGAVARVEALEPPLSRIGRAALDGGDPGRSALGAGYRERRSARFAHHVARALRTRGDEAPSARD